METLGLVLLIYAGFVGTIGVTKKPDSMWKIVKMKLGRSLPDSTTSIILYVVAAIAAGFGIWFMV
jgi:hypothetical protein